MKAKVFTYDGKRRRRIWDRYILHARPF